jgi:hypothetical protein
VRQALWLMAAYDWLASSERRLCLGNRRLVKAGPRLPVMLIFKITASKSESSSRQRASPGRPVPGLSRKHGRDNYAEKLRLRTT